MARGQDGNKQPEVGDVFAFPIGKKLYSFCWIARKTKPEWVYSSRLKKWFDVPYFAIACANWVGSWLPNADEIASRKLLRLTADGRTREPLVLLDNCAPPRGFVKVGRVSMPTASKVRENYSGFKYIQIEAKRQWRWDHERGKLIADDDAEERAEAAAEAAVEEALATKVSLRRKAALADIGRVELLPEWQGLVGARHRKAVEKLLRDLIAQLRRANDRTGKLAAIESVVLRINAWNDRTGVIETEEREALATAIDDLGHKAGLRGHDLAGDFREW